MRKGFDYDSELTVTVSPDGYRARLVTLLVRVLVWFGNYMPNIPLHKAHSSF